MRGVPNKLLIFSIVGVRETIMVPTTSIFLGGVGTMIVRFAKLARAMVCVVGTRRAQLAMGHRC
jgi:hypothetical protein